MTTPPCPREVVISSDSHVSEPLELWESLPEFMKVYAPDVKELPDGGEEFCLEGSKLRLPLQENLSEDDWACEYRLDPSGGADLKRRMADMAREGVDAQVVFPDSGLGLGGGSGSREYHVGMARVYNDWVAELFAPESKRFLPAALIPMDDIEAALSESQRCLEKGFKTLFLPAVVPERPYWHRDYEPLWALAAEAGVPISFHVFAGNLWFGTDFSFLPFLSPERYETAKQVSEAEGAVPERMGTTVIGMAAGMGPIIHLTGSGVLERHPNLRFAVIEAECGWLAWVLSAMDSMQERRHLYLSKLPLKASEYFLRQGSVAITEDPVGLHNLPLTGSECLLWGNDYPHDEGTFPYSRRVIDDMRKFVAPDALAKILAGNAANLYGFDLEYLASHPIEETVV